MEGMYCDSGNDNVILFTVINTFYTCQADVKTKMTVGMFMCRRRISSKETCGLCAEQHLLQHCFQLSGW